MTTTDIHARIVMDPLSPEYFDEWREQINKLLCAEFKSDSVTTLAGTIDVSGWHLPDHELRIEVDAPFIPTDLHGVLQVDGTDLPWCASLDLDASYEIPDAIRKRICVFYVSQE